MKGTDMDIGRLEFYATKRDKYGHYFGKIYPCEEAVRSNYNGGLVFFHELRIPQTSALRTDSRYKDYRYKTRSYDRSGRKIYRNPVYVAFDAPESPATDRDAAATVVMLLGEADFDKLPDYASVTEVVVKAALISAFPRQFALPRIGLEILSISDHGDRLKLLKCCWDSSHVDERVAFLESLDLEKLVTLITCLVDIDREDDRKLQSPNRVCQAIAARPDATLQPDIAAMLRPSMWSNELFDLMDSVDDRRTLFAQAPPSFCAYAIAKYAEAGKVLNENDAHTFRVAIRECSDRNFAAACARSALAKQPNIALGDDFAPMLIPAYWVDELLSLMKSPTERRAFLAQTNQAFHIHAITRYIESGGQLDDEDAKDLVMAIHECRNDNLSSSCLTAALNHQPTLALRSDIGALLTPALWSDGLLELMKRLGDMRSFLACTQPDFRAYAIAKFAEESGQLDRYVIDAFESAVRDSDDKGFVAECMMTVLAKQPDLALKPDLAILLTPDMWVDELFEIMKEPKAQKVIFASSQPEFQAYAVGKLVDAGMPLGDEAFTMCPLRSCPNLLNRVQWSRDDAPYVDMIGRWLDEACLHDADGRQLIVMAAERMHSTRELLSPAMWNHLPAAMRIRLCIFWSNYYANLDDYVVRGGITKLCVNAYRNQWNGHDQTLKAAMLLLALPLSKDMRKVFLDANDALIGEIVRQFNECGPDRLQSFVLNAELQSLLQRCTAYSYVNEKEVKGFCDGREWKKAMSVWCHAGPDRPGGGRQKCKSLTSPINANDANRTRSSNLENQFMADLLANANDAIGGVIDVGPWLNTRKELDIVEYAYRVSAYVNKMSAALPHMVCRGCGARLRLNYEYPRKSLYEKESSRNLDLPALPATVCSCPNRSDKSTWHDVNIYIHYCLNCHRIIDSRECKRRDKEGYYLCMYCGASKVFKPATACPSCGNTNPRTLRYYTGSMIEELDYRSGKPSFGDVLIACKATECMYDARDFISGFESERE